MVFVFLGVQGHGRPVCEERRRRKGDYGEEMEEEK